MSAFCYTCGSDCDATTIEECPDCESEWPTSLNVKLAIADAAREAVMVIENTDLCELVFRGGDPKQAENVKAKWTNLLALVDKFEATSILTPFPIVLHKETTNDF